MKSPEAIRLLNHVKRKTAKNLKEYGQIYPQLFQKLLKRTKTAPMVPANLSNENLVVRGGRNSINCSETTGRSSDRSLLPQSMDRNVTYMRAPEYRRYPYIYGCLRIPRILQHAFSKRPAGQKWTGVQPACGSQRLAARP